MIAMSLSTHRLHVPSFKGRVMQVFQRGVNESLTIGPDVVVTVLEIQPHCVRIAVENHGPTPSYREETLYFDRGGDVMTAGSTPCAEPNLVLGGTRYLGW